MSKIARKHLIFIGLFIVNVAYAQEEYTYLTKALRINFINPGIEFETPVSAKVVFNTNIGVGYGGSYLQLTEYRPGGLLYMISPFFDIRHKRFYNQRKRIAGGKNIAHNSGNFYGLRFLTRGQALSSNFYRTSNIDFSVGPRWGMQRSVGNFFVMFDIGPVIYFDNQGNSGFFLLISELSLGYNLFK